MRPDWPERKFYSLWCLNDSLCKAHDERYRFRDVISRLRMCLVVNLNQFLHGNMSVNLRGRKTCVPQQFLNVAQICAAVEQVRRERMPQRVGADVVNARAQPDIFFYQASDRTRRHARTLIIQNQGLRVAFRRRSIHQEFFAH